MNDKVTFTKQYVNDRLCASDIKYLKDDDVFADTRVIQQYNNSSNTNNSVKQETIPYSSQETYESDDNLNKLKSRAKLYNDNKQAYYSVLSYIKSLSTNELLNTIAYKYEHIRGTLNNAPAMGEYGSVEFAGALLIWKYCKDHLYSDKSQICGSLMINLGDTIGCAYLGMSAGEWSNKMDMVIYTNDVLDYTEWNYIYNYLKENYMIYIHKFEFCKGILSEDERQTIYSSFVKRYNQLDTLSQVFALYQKVGLNLKSDMPFAING